MEIANKGKLSKGAWLLVVLFNEATIFPTILLVIVPTILFAIALAILFNISVTIWLAISRARRQDFKV